VDHRLWPIDPAGADARAEDGRSRPDEGGDVMVEVTGQQQWAAAARPGPTDRQPEDVQVERERARKQVERKHKLRADVVAYVVINLFLIGTWAVTGFGYFWPGWVLAGWGMLLVLDAWNAYFRRPVTEEEIDREIARR
jgi:hypothetical protein